MESAASPSEEIKAEPELSSTVTSETVSSVSTTPSQAVSSHLKGLKKKDLSMVISFMKAPAAVEQVFEVVLGLLGEEDTTWANARKLANKFD